MKDIEIEINQDANEIGLAELISSLIRDNCNQSKDKREIFYSLKGDVLVYAKDADVSILLSFNKGKLTIYNGIGRNTEFSINATSENIIDLSNLRLLSGFPLLLDKTGYKIIKGFFTGEIKINGVMKNILFGINLLRIISVN